LHPPAGPLEEHGAEFGLETRDSLAERWLRYPHPVSGSTEVQLFGHGEERAKVSQLHR